MYRRSVTIVQINPVDFSLHDDTSVLVTNVMLLHTGVAAMQPMMLPPVQPTMQPLVQPAMQPPVQASMQLVMQPAPMTMAQVYSLLSVRVFRKLIDRV